MLMVTRVAVMIKFELLPTGPDGFCTGSRQPYIASIGTRQTGTSAQKTHKRFKHIITNLKARLARVLVREVFEIRAYQGFG